MKDIRRSAAAFFFPPPFFLPLTKQLQTRLQGGGELEYGGIFFFFLCLVRNPVFFPSSLSFPPPPPPFPPLPAGTQPKEGKTKNETFFFFSPSLLFFSFRAHPISCCYWTGRRTGDPPLPFLFFSFSFSLSDPGPVFARSRSFESGGR